MLGRTKLLEPCSHATLSSYAVAVALHGGGTSTLLALASALHRRNVDVVDARLIHVSLDRQSFRATIVATPQQARTVEATLRNIVPVVDVQVFQCAALAPSSAGTGG